MKKLVNIFLLVIISTVLYFSYIKLNEVYSKLKKKNLQIYEMQYQINELTRRNYSKEFYNNKLYDSNGIQIFDIFKFNLPYEDDLISKKPLGYLEKYENNLLYMSAKGDLFIYEGFLPINYSKINNKNVPIEINSNFESFILDQNQKDECFENYVGFNGNSYVDRIVRDILIKEEHLFVAILNIKKRGKSCFASTSIIKGKINLYEKNIIFKEYFNSGHEIDILEESFDDLHAGGVMSILDEKIILAYPDYGIIEKVQLDENPFGKIIAIKSKSDYEIISKGHRNPQGLFYDKDEKKLLSTEHGPDGGDEINLIKKNKNYGWPIASYYKNELPNKFTISREHKSLGFEEPLWAMKSRKEWDFNIAPSRIIKFKDNYYVLSMSWSWKSGHGILEFELTDDKLNLINKYHLFSRARDILKVDDFNLLIVLENNNEVIILRALK